MQKLTKNIDLVQIDIEAGTEEYFLPKNVDWNGQIIDRILLVAPASDGTISPTDARHVLTAAEVKGLYLDLYNGEEQQIANGLSHTAILATNNQPWLPNCSLSLDLSRIYFAEAPEVDGCILLYIFHGTREELTDDPSRHNKTVRFTLEEDEQITFQELIDNYVHVDGHKIRGIQVYKGKVYLNLRDHDLSYIFRQVHSSLLRPQTNYGHLGQVEPMLLDAMDIDFDYSTIRNAVEGSEEVVITFEY